MQLPTSSSGISQEKLRLKRLLLLHLNWQPKCILVLTVICFLSCKKVEDASEPILNSMKSYCFGDILCDPILFIYLFCGFNSLLQNEADGVLHHLLNSLRLSSCAFEKLVSRNSRVCTVSTSLSVILYPSYLQ